MTEAYIDDSGNFRQGKTCLLAGYVAPTDAWAEFSDRWDAVLKEATAIEFFKMSDAFALKKQFDGWTTEARDAKVDRLVDVIIAARITYGAAVAMINADYLRVGRGALDSHINDAFYFLFTNVMETCLIHQQRSGIHEKIDFIFDDTDKPSIEIDRLFRQTMFTAPERIKALQLVDKPPVFRNEKIFLPLQAADLLAGQIRSWYERGQETTAMKKLGGSDVRLAFNLYDARMFETMVKGAQITRAHMQSGPPGQELARFMEIKTFLEQISELEERGRAASPQKL